MSRPPLTIWEQAQMQGYSRRDFLQFCSWIAAAAGIHASGVPQVVEALDSKPRPTVVWFHFQECTCCSESFIRSNHPHRVGHHPRQDLPRLHRDAAGGGRAPGRGGAADGDGEAQGPVPDAGRRVGAARPTTASTAASAGAPPVDIVKEAAAGAAAVICWGSCASQRLRPGREARIPPRPRRSTDVVSGVPIIKVPGCPPIAEVMAGVDRPLPRLRARFRNWTASAGRRRSTRGACTTPAIAGRTTTPACSSRSFDDENAKRGYCLYKMGCRGPVTYNACGVIRWNGGVSYPIQSGHGCIGCSEAKFWDNGPFYQHLASLPGLRHRDHGRHGRAWSSARSPWPASPPTPSATNIRKRKLIAEEIRDSEQIPETEVRTRRRGQRRPSWRTYCHRPRHPHRRPPARRSRSEGRQGRRRLQLRHDGARLRDHPARAATRAMPGRSPSARAASAPRCTRSPPCARSRTRWASRCRPTPNSSATSCSARSTCRTTSSTSTTCTPSTGWTSSAR